MSCLSSLVERAKSGDKPARDELTLAHLPLVNRISRQLTDNRDLLEDLQQEGICGLLDSIRTYDASRGPFGAHASHYILRDMCAFLLKEIRGRCERLPAELLVKSPTLDAPPLLDRLFPAERDIVERYFGVGRDESQPVADIAAQRGTGERFPQQAIRKYLRLVERELIEK